MRRLQPRPPRLRPPQRASIRCNPPWCRAGRPRIPLTTDNAPPDLEPRLWLLIAWAVHGSSNLQRVECAQNFSAIGHRPGERIGMDESAVLWIWAIHGQG